MIKKNCLKCNKEFSTTQSNINRGQGKFCSLSCSTVYTKTKYKTPNVLCSLCGVEFYKKPSALKNSRSGLQFCSRVHKDQAQKLGGLSAIQPPHYGTGNSAYRRRAFDNFPAKCSYCGYAKYKEVLEVHHKDGNHSNSKIENLEIVCPTCHNEKHYLSNSGRYKGKAE